MNDPNTQAAIAFAVCFILAAGLVVGWMRASSWKRTAKRMERGQILDSKDGREAIIRAGEAAAARLRSHPPRQSPAVQSELKPVKTGKGSGRHAERGRGGRFKPVG